MKQMEKEVVETKEISEKEKKKELIQKMHENDAEKRKQAAIELALQLIG